MINRPDYRSRISQYNGTLNAFVDQTKELGDGLAWAVKSNIAVKNLPLTAGCAAYKNSIAVQDSEVVSRIRQAGGIILGTVNMHEGALGATTDNPEFGRTFNPWRHGYTAGGSSGGSAAAVAAGLCDIALGTDTMGSVRIPSAYCGVQGHKPTYGIVPTSGVVPLSTSLDYVGPIARDVDTLWKAMSIISSKKFDGELPLTKLKGLKIGVWSGTSNIDISEAVIRGFEDVCKWIQEEGAIIGNFNPPDYEYSKSRRAGLLVSEIEAATAHGISTEDETPDGFSKEFIEMMRWGSRQSIEKKTEAYKQIEVIRNSAKRIWCDFDFVISPTAPQQAFSFDDNVPANQADFTAWANFANLPATSIYSGLSAAHLPLALQILGPTNQDAGVLGLAATLETIFGKPPMPVKYSFVS